MATTPDNEIPPVPVPPVEPTPDASVPPVPAPAAPASPAAPAPLPPVSPAPPAAAAARPDPYAAPGQAAPYAGSAQPNPYAPVAAGPVQTLSIIAMIAGIVGVLGSFIGLGFLPALAAVIMGHMAQKRQPWAKPFWVTALVTGYVGVSISIITGLFILVVFLTAIATGS